MNTKKNKKETVDEENVMKKMEWIKWYSVPKVCYLAQMFILIYCRLLSFGFIFSDGKILRIDTSVTRTMNLDRESIIIHHKSGSFNGCQGLFIRLQAHAFIVSTHQPTDRPIVSD